MKISKRFIIYILVFLVAVSICVLQNACIDAALKKHQYLQLPQLANHHYEGLEQFLYQNICGMSLASGLTDFVFITKDRTVCQVDFSGSFQIIPEMNNVTAICHGGDSTMVLLFLTHAVMRRRRKSCCYSLLMWVLARGQQSTILKNTKQLPMPLFFVQTTQVKVFSCIKIIVSRWLDMAGQKISV